MVLVAPYVCMSRASMKDRGKILINLVARGKGHPPSKRLKSKSKQIITQMHKKKEVFSYNNYFTCNKYEFA